MKLLTCQYCIPTTKGHRPWCPNSSNAGAKVVDVLRFQDLKPGDLFRLLIDGKPSDEIFLVVCFDIFHLDRVVRVRDKRGGGRAVVVTGMHAGQYEGYFCPGNIVERVQIVR